MSTLQELPLGLISLDYESWTSCLDDAAARGLRLAELYVVDGAPTRDTDAVRSYCDEHGVDVSSVGCLSKLSQAEQGDRDSLEAQTAQIDRCMEIAVALGAPRVAFMYGGSALLSRRDARLRFLDRLAPLADRASRLGLTLLIENVFSRAPSGDLDTVENTIAVFDLLDGLPVRLNFDVGNFAIAGEEAYPYAFEVLRPYIGSIHLKDVARYWAPRHPNADQCRPLVDHQRGLFVTEPLGCGSVNVAGLLRSILNGSDVPPLMLESFSGGARRTRWLDASLKFIADVIRKEQQ